MMKAVRRCCLGLLILGIIFISPFFCSSAHASDEITITSPDEWELFSWDDAITMKWRAVSGAAGYYVSIRNMSTNTPVLQNKWTTSTSLKISNYLPDEKGKYKLWVCAVDSDSMPATCAFATGIIYIYVAHEPDITNGTASAITESGATLQLTINLDYGYSISDHGFYIGTSSTKSRMTQYSLGSTGKGTKTLTVSGLDSGEKYYYRAYAVNDVGEEYTTAKNFTTLSTTYEVAYNANGGSGAPASQTKEKDVALTLSTVIPTRPGYTFLGWSVSKTATIPQYSSGASYTDNADLLLYAIWEPVTYTISYNANGGIGAPVSQTKSYNAALTLSSVQPTRTGYIFKGWAASSTAAAAEYASGAAYTTNADITLYAVWEQEQTLSGASITLPAGLESIEQEAFINGAFSSVLVPDGTISIGARAFAYCKKLIRIDIPSTVRFISDNAFTGSSNVTIYGISGSYAESYADRRSLPFISIGTSPTPTPGGSTPPPPPSDVPTTNPTHNPLPDPEPTVTGGGGNNPLPASEPEVSNSATAQSYHSQEIADYNRGLGGFNLEFTSANASKYHVTAIILNETPLFGSSEEAANQKNSAQMVKILYDDDTTRTSLPFQLSDLQLGSYLKIAVGAYSSGNTTGTADAWTVFGLKLINNQSGNLPSGSKLNFASAIWSELKSWGFSDVQAAGIMGNIRAESAYCPYNAQNDYGYPGVDNRSDYVFKVDDEVGFGLCQWTVSSRKQRLLNHAGDDSVWSFDVQMSYLHWELQNMVIGGTTFEKYLKNLTTLKEVAEVFMTDFEGPKDQSSTAKQLRVRYAQEAYEAYASQTVSFSMTHSQLSGNTLTLSSAATAGDFSTLSVTSNTSWTATLSDNNFVKFVATDADSATIHNAASASGAAGETLKLRIQIVKTPNAGSTSSATLTVRVGGEIKAYTITQTIPGTSSEAAPTLSLSLNRTTVSNSGRGCIGISFSATNADTFSFEFNGLEVEEAYDRNYSSQKQGFKSLWNFGTSDFAVNGNNYSSTSFTCYFYIAANTNPRSYAVTMTVSGKGGSISKSLNFTVKAPYVPQSSSIHLAWKSAEYEISRFYEKLCKVNITDPCERFIEVATSQEGYHEGNIPNSNSYCDFSALSGESTGGDNFTEYLYAYAGNASTYQANYEKLISPSASIKDQAWCAYFVSWCARAAGISTSVLPNSTGAGPGPGAFQLPGRGASAYKNLTIKEFNNLKISRSYSWKSYADGAASPKRGDLLFFGSTTAGTYDSYEAAAAQKASATTHVAILTAITENSDGSITFSTIEGNRGNQVQAVKRTVLNDNRKNGLTNTGEYIRFWGSIYWE